MSDWPLVMEDALRAHLLRRCKRAYAHEMRNGLQGIHGGVDALARAARPDKPTSRPIEQVAEFVRQAITNHEHGLELVLESMAPEAVAPALVPIKGLLSDLIKFLINDATRQSVRFSMEMTEEMAIESVPAKLRLIFLALLTEAIDAMPAGGDIRISGQKTASCAQIDIIDGRTGEQPDSFVVEAISHVVAQLSGRIDRKQVTEMGYHVRVELPI